MRSSSGYSLVHILSTSSSKSAPLPAVFTILCDQLLDDDDDVNGDDDDDDGDDDDDI